MIQITVKQKELDSSAAVSLDDELCLKSLTHQGQPLELDMSNVTYIGSAALGVMLSHEQHFETITLINVHEKVKNVIDILGLDLILKVK